MRVLNLLGVGLWGGLSLVAMTVVTVVAVPLELYDYARRKRDGRKHS